ncbi:hypothetical protein AK830_g9499 [Neonectria ditissima]|uniref:NmrA-like domain-containing protein n=1 Tax=Neonectria ditissima TaxID=78410 RepID=A0A0P7B8Z5_9HYPO|nr:hypothetical protein AK830_g9499 [Neonectria ditissima]
MRVAVAGGGGLGYILAKALSEAPSAHSVVVLSRYNRPEYASLDIQVLQVNYNDLESLAYALQGVNLVVSVVKGNEQLNLINAAATSGVQLFVPAEFEGSLDKRSSRHDPLDPESYSSQARSLMRSLSLRYTIFSCGVFMERFHPFGLGGSVNIGVDSDLSEAGSYLLDINTATAEIVEKDSDGHTVRICMTSVHDLAQFVVAALDLGPANWPREFTLRGDRMSVRDVVGTASRYLNTPFQIQNRQAGDLQPWISHYAQAGDPVTAARYQRLLATVNGRYDFRTSNLNDAIHASPYVEDVRPMTFRQWLASVYQSPA